MKIYIHILCLFFSFSSLLLSQQKFYSEPFAHTYSIVARDPYTGEMGVAVQSHWFSVGSIVGWGEAGVGVVATQSFVNVSYKNKAKLCNYNNFMRIYKKCKDFGLKM